MDKKINKNLAAIKNSIDKKSKNIDNSISNSKQEIIEQVNKPWHKDSKVILSLVITIVFTIFAICISYYVSNHFSEKTDKTLEEIKNVATNTNIEVKRLTGSIIEKTGDGEKITINKKIVKKAYIYPNGSIFLWANLNMPDSVYSKGYVFDIGDSLIKNRMSLFVDENGFLNWKIYESNYNIHVLKYDINRYLKGEAFFFIGLTWTKEGELTMYLYGVDEVEAASKGPVSKIKLDKLKLNVTSKDMYWGSDIAGNYVIDLGC